MVESPPLFLGYSAILLSKKLKAKLIFNVSDLWPESAEKLNLVNNRSLLNLAYSLEKKCYEKAFLVTGQTMGIVDNIKSRFPQKEVYWLPNGVDLNYYNPESKIESNFRKDNAFGDTDFLIFYGGIIGYAQGLEVILNAANELKSFDKIKFILQGSGPELERLMLLKTELELNNVYFLPPVNKKMMPSILFAIDVAVVPLKKLDLFRGAIPSKIFEALSMKVPLLLGVDGEAKEHFIDKANAGLYFEPENSNDLAKKVRQLYLDNSLVIQMGENGRLYVNQWFNRNNIANNLYDKLVQNV
jgi:glycosyltransferase involved in cell wall biosynthesis